MAELSERDKRVILGENYRAELAEADRISGVTENARNTKAEIVSLDEKRVLGGYITIVGIVLIMASWFTVKDNALLIQGALGIAIMALGIWVFTRSHKKGRTARVQLAAFE